MFYKPWILSLIENVSSGPTAAFHISIPEKFNNRTYGEMFRELLTEHNLITISIYAEAGSMASQEMIKGKTGNIKNIL